MSRDVGDPARCICPVVPGRPVICTCAASQSGWVLRRTLRAIIWKAVHR